MRTSITAAIVATAIAITILMVSGLSFAQSGWRKNTYQRCVELASQQGVNVKSASGRRYVDRCMQRDTCPGPSRNCPDDSKARSAYPAWMCP
ncbi:MAG: hypothetical protein K2Y71_08715 [Xanthobacteraceae bacterium]|nr:hypothetical protein [Xanthobacteraceae bacterium]